VSKLFKDKKNETDEPSIKETQFFIIEKTSLKINDGVYTIIFETSFPEQCHIRIDAKYKPISGRLDSDYNEIEYTTAFLKELDPNEIEHHNHEILAWATDKSFAVNFHFANSSAHSSELYEQCKSNLKRRPDRAFLDGSYCREETRLPVLALNSSSDDAPRVAKAMKHLTTLCGGKSPIF